MAEAVWSGFLRLSLVSCPVRLEPATGDAHSLRLDQLNSRTGNPVATQYVDSRTGDVVAADAVVRGYQSGEARHIALTEAELAGLAGAPANIVEVAHFAPRDQVERARLDTSYYIYPDGELAPETLEAVRLAMQRAEPGWAGHPGSRRQIEAMSIRPRDELQPSAIEFRVFAQEGRATAWVSNGNYAGTRGRQLPLTGFAVRPAPEMRDRFDIIYEGCFFDGGVVGPKRNGEICTSAVQNDPLEAVRITIVERPAA